VAGAQLVLGNSPSLGLLARLRFEIDWHILARRFWLIFRWCCCFWFLRIRASSFGGLLFEALQLRICAIRAARFRYRDRSRLVLSALHVMRLRARLLRHRPAS